jgi:ferredoxin
MALSVDFTACDAHGLCAELLPELIGLDEWGYPMIRGTVPQGLLPEARRAVAACPMLALRLVPAPPPVAGQVAGQVADPVAAPVSAQVAAPPPPHTRSTRNS